jgi:hypothetical protein
MAFLNGMKRICPDMNWLEIADESCQRADGRKTVVSCGDAAVTGDRIGAKERDEVGRDVDDCKTVDRDCFAAKGITWQSASRQPCWVLRARLRSVTTCSSRKRRPQGPGRASSYLNSMQRWMPIVAGLGA